MCAVQLMRVSVQERLSFAAEDLLQQLETRDKAAGEKLRPLVTDRLMAVAEEILRLFEKTVEEYENSLQRSEQKICHQERLLDAVFNPQVRLQRADVQLLEMISGLDPQIKQKDMETEDDGGDCGVLESDKSLPPAAADEASRSLSQDGQQTLKEREFHSSNDEKTQMESLDEPGRDDTEKKPFLCILCGKRFTHLRSLSYHLKVHWETSSCSICGKTMTMKSQQYHKLIHTGAKPFSCVTCKKTFREPAQVRQHKCVDGLQQLTLRCDECGEQFLEKSLLVAHKKIHAKAKQQKQWLTCTVCGVQRQYRSQMKQHMISHKLRCSTCGRTFAKKKKFMQHIAVHMTFSCSDCDKRFCRSHHLKNHTCPTKRKRKHAYTKSETSVEANSGVDSNFRKDTRQDQSGYTCEGKKKISIEERGCDPDSKPLSSPDVIASDPQSDEWFVYECRQETKTLESDLTSVIYWKICESDTMTEIQPFPYEGDLSLPAMIHTEERMAMKEENADPRQIKEEPEEDAITFTFSPDYVKTENHEEKCQTEVNGDCVEGSKPDPDPHSDQTSDSSETGVSDGDWGQ